MCFAVYIGTEKELELGQFIPEQTDIYFEKLTPVRAKLRLVCNFFGKLCLQ